MKPNRALALALSIFSLALFGCSKIRTEIRKKSALTNMLDNCIDKPVQDFLNQTGWIPTAEYTWKNSGKKQLEFNTIKHTMENNPGGMITYTKFANGFPVAYLNPRESYMTIPGHGTGTQIGCKLKLIINTNGKIQSWHLKGGDCSIDTLNVLKME